MAAPRAQQVIKEQIALRPERYPKYHKDLIELLNEELREIGDGASAANRRKKLGDAIKAKASQIPLSEGT
jgi:hypothetical protein